MSLEAQAAELLERAKQQWPTPVPEEALAHWSESQRLAWRRAEKVTIDGEFDTLAKWIHGEYGTDKRRFAWMYLELREFAEGEAKLIQSYQRDMPTEAAKMMAQLVRRLSTIDADFRAEWFRIRWGESIGDYRKGAAAWQVVQRGQGGAQGQGGGCLVAVLFVVVVLISEMMWHSLRL
jgi:hypothetical protein